MESTRTEVWPGQAYPLGATYDGIGTNFTLFSEVAERVELCLGLPLAAAVAVTLLYSRGKRTVALVATSFCV